MTIRRKVIPLYGALFGGITLMPPRAAGRCLPAARLARATNRLPIPTEPHRSPSGECPASSFRAPRIARCAVAVPECREPARRNLGHSAVPAKWQCVPCTGFRRERAARQAPSGTFSPLNSSLPRTQNLDSSARWCDSFRAPKRVCRLSVRTFGKFGRGNVRAFPPRPWRSPVDRTDRAAASAARNRNPGWRDRPLCFHFSVEPTKAHRTELIYRCGALAPRIRSTNQNAQIATKESAKIPPHARKVDP
jgi:hypothetical protein